MEKRMECPICKEKALFVGVHDDEGNYHGRVGCEYEKDSWSGLSYALHHEGWGDCPLCTDGPNSPMGGMLFDTAEEAISSLYPPNEPLTLDELREMDGEPVWVEHNNGGEWIVIHWDYVGRITTAYKACLLDHEYGKTWIAYHCPPEGDDEK